MLDKTIKKSAVIIDGGYLREIYKHQMGVPITADKVVEIGGKVLDKNEELFRIYYYDCVPFEKDLRTPISNAPFKNTTLVAHMKSYLAKIGASDMVAFRTGNLKFDGWGLKDHKLKGIISGTTVQQWTDADFKPMFKQKGIDMKIGLDIAWLAIRKIVTRIILIAGDSDFIPAMKLARVEGVQIVTVPFRPQVSPDMREHSDEVRILDISKL